MGYVDLSLHNKPILVVTDYFVLDWLEECYLVNRMDYAGLVSVNDQSLHNKSKLTVNDSFLWTSWRNAFWYSNEFSFCRPGSQGQGLDENFCLLIITTLILAQGDH